MTEKPIPLRDQRWPEGTPPVVSIFCITYNHEKFIRDAIEGFLMQETTFPVEIFVHDDASKDGTQAILKEYQEKYPSLFRMVLQKENQWSKKGNGQFLELISNLPGEYIAFCEGDDYWKKASKIQKQYNLLKKEPSFSLTGHFTDIVSETGSPTGEPAIPAFPYKSRTTLAEYLRKNYIGFQLSSWMARARCFHDTNWIRGLAMGDIPLMIHLASQGDLGFISEHMSCYRRHGSSYWGANPGSWQARASFQVFSAAAKRLKGEHRRIAKEIVSRQSFALAESLYHEGNVLLAVFEMIRFCARRLLIGTAEADTPSIEVGARRIKQMLAQQKHTPQKPGK